MPTDADTTIEVSHQGEVAPRLIDAFVDKVAATASHCREDVRRIEVRLTLDANPASSRPATAEATLDIDGAPVRAHVAAPTITEAADLAVDRLARRIQRHEDRRHRLPDRHRAAGSGEGEWRHGDLPTDRPDYRLVPFDEREVRRRKSLALPPISVDDALFDLEQLGHDFYLFVEASTGLDAVVAHRHDPTGVARGGFEVRSLDPDGIATAPIPDGVGVVPAPPPVLDLAAAREYLEASGEKYVFHRATPDGRGQVLYRRFDGHDGLLTASDA